MNNVKVEKITAPNGSVFTGAGTNTYLVGENDISIVDPGPNIKSHLDKIIKKVGKKASRILVTHTHRDHSPGAKYIAEKLNIPTFGRLVEVDDGHQDLSFTPDNVLNHGDLISTREYSLEAVYTPGHASNHFCFFIDANALMLTGDHIMNGSTVVIAHPDGSMKQYLQSLELLKSYDFKKIGPGHGDYLSNPIDVISWIINHRLQREAKVLEKLDNEEFINELDLVKLVYDDVDSKLHPIALWSLKAHLVKLKEEKRIANDQAEDCWLKIV